MQQILKVYLLVSLHFHHSQFSTIVQKYQWWLLQLCMFPKCFIKKKSWAETNYLVMMIIKVAKLIIFLFTIKVTYTREIQVQLFWTLKYIQIFVKNYLEYCKNFCKIILKDNIVSVIQKVNVVDPNELLSP